MNGINKSRVEKFALGGARPVADRGPLHVGLVNNMPDGALRTTELEFAKLLKDASGAVGANAMDVRLHLFSLPDIPRGEVTRSRMEGFYEDAALLPAAGLDALIITDAEPRTGNLRDEPYWRALTYLIDWAEIGTISTYFSGLAAHAAVLHMDHIARRRLDAKLSGVFASERACDDTLLTGLAAHARVPHSRRHDLSSAHLAANGYRILSRLADGSPDLFCRRRHSLFLFAQGHPEHDVATLGRDYLRDVARFLEGAGEYPSPPENYFDRLTEDRLLELAAENVRDLSRYKAVVHGALPLASWQGHTVKLFANWLAAVTAEKARRATGRPASVRSRKRA
jgi:homoserine O-succinyltransferase